MLTNGKFEPNYKESLFAVTFFLDHFPYIFKIHLHPSFLCKEYFFFQCLYLYVLIVYDICKSGQQFSLAPS